MEATALIEEFFGTARFCDELLVKAEVEVLLFKDGELLLVEATFVGSEGDLLFITAPRES